MGPIRDVIKRLIGQRNLGRLDFFRQPELRASWGGPFNGQRFRLRIFAELLHQIPAKAIVETGTYRGTTTALFAAMSVPVYTTEVQPRNVSYVRLRFLMSGPHVHLSQGDSRSFLTRLSQDPSVPKEDVFFYLDAHWQDDLPLREEADIIFKHWPGAVVMVDDFCVPGTGYGFDDYGPGKALTLDYIAPVVGAHQLAVFFPSADPAEETGMKRGSVVLCKEKVARVIDDKVKTLSRVPARR